MWTGNLSPRFTALAVSSALVPRPDDWPQYVQMTGFYFWDRPSNWQFPEILKAFLHGDKPIVAVTAGSVAPEKRALFFFYFQTSIESIPARSSRALVINAPPNPIFSQPRGEVALTPL